ncbi:hypothetical protein [Luteibacter sp. 22Crub2.1]|uniref:DUF6988 family protein n=1 Tax=Luteibacter sp. 22Crub2.1 TaxID=1283288 RepID=UPI0009A598AE|nr:hypothetical protein [Luteibacter sp. 22Crub2.1]SKB27856.1 hypothetical protein SAMN05660880_00295 [Luteibacter sp. 22Crub2.1]
MSKLTPAAEIASLLERTEAFEAALLAPINRVPFQDTDRAKLSMVFLGLAHEHWVAIRSLAGVGLNHSAIALIRLQFEATLKAFWVWHAATDHWIQLCAQVNKRPDGSVIEPPRQNTSDYFKDIERTAPPGIHALLTQFKQVAWNELNSYVHGGVHALANVGREQPPLFIVELVCNSNGVAGLGAMLAASLTGDANRVDAVLAAQYAHIDVLPKGPPTGQTGVDAISGPH